MSGTINAAARAPASSHARAVTVPDTRATHWQRRLAQWLGTSNAAFRAACLLACAAIFAAHMLYVLVGDNPEGIRLTVGAYDFAGALVLALGLEPGGWGDPTLALVVVNAAAFVLFALGVWAVTADRVRHGRRVLGWVALQIFIGVTFESDLLYIVAAELPMVFALRHALLWLLGQTITMVCVWVGVFWLHSGDITVAVGEATIVLEGMALAQLFALVAMSVVMTVAWQAFAFMLGYVAMSERRSRLAAAHANAELRATHHLLAESAKANERLRIARDLHDGLGHHLAALGLHLELAARHAPEPDGGPLRTAQAIAKALFGEVRAAVGRERGEQPLDLRGSLERLCAGVPEPRVELDFDVDCRVADPAVAHAVFRGVQESVSNAVRHARAHTVSVGIRRTHRGVTVEVVDDGVGRDEVRYGHGLDGMRERIEGLGGVLDVGAAPGRGLSVRFVVPDHA
ncbi:MAG: sensor histidine kinase [Rhodocyclaceae bacterium]